MAEPAHDRARSTLVDKFKEREERWRREQAEEEHQRESAAETKNEQETAAQGTVRAEEEGGESESPEVDEGGGR